MLKKDTIYAIVCMVISSVFFFWLIPTNTPKTSLAGDIQPSLIPSSMMVIIFFSGLAVLIQTRLDMMKTKKADSESGVGQVVSESAPLRLVLAISLIFTYLLCIKYIGFYLVTIFFMTGTLRYLNKNMFWPKCLLATIILLIFIYFLFEKGLWVNMPHGIFL